MKKRKALNEAVETKIEEEFSDDSETENSSRVDAGDHNVEKMTVAEIKAHLKERDLSIKGDKKVLTKRLIERFAKEKDPEYQPKRKGRHCKWCDNLMKKKRGFKGDFYGCTAYPNCLYTTSLSGHANPQKEHLKGVAATGGGYGSSMSRLDWAHHRDRQERRAEHADDRAMKKIWG